VTVTLTANDNLSGVAATNWSLDGAATQTGTSVPVATEGDHVLSFWSVDKAGNTETTHTIHVRIDKTPPTISDAESPPANVNGWNNSSVTVTFTCGDALSGVASCTAPQNVTAEGKAQVVTGTAVDNAGNTANDPVSVNIDETKPTISGSPDRSPNGNGWYNAPVTVTFACGDALSGINTCTKPIVLGEGQNQSATGTAVDAAGNTSNTTVSGINVDTTAPTIYGTATTSPNANGWYNGDVIIHWTCADNLSGAVNCPANSTITGSGPGLTVTASVSDAAGNTTMATSPPVNIDRKPPTTISDAPTGWQTNDVTVHFTAVDDYAGVDATYFTLNGGPAQSGSSVVISGEGITTLEFWSVDRAGNTELPNFAQVQLDKSAPTITHSQSPAANGAGWNNTPVKVSFHCNDTVSGVGFCTADQTLSDDGANQIVMGTAVDNAGNTANDNATVNIDQAPPTISGAPDRNANANGWYNADVNVAFKCDDTLSGVATCTAPSTLGEGQNQSVAGTATDKAGNTASTTVSNINVDETPPTISGAPTSSPNTNDWYNSDVTVEWSCGDNLSGVDTCPPDSTISGEGTDLSTSATVSDKAGNSTTGTVDHINIDRTPPATTASAPSGWVNNDVTMTLSATDNLSGVDTTSYVLDGGSPQTGNSVVIGSEGIHTLKYWSTDKAGNQESPHSVTIKVDKTAPTITHTQSPDANAQGWNNTDVTVKFSCDDALSGVASCTSPQTLTSEGQAQQVVGTAVDNAGNSATDKATVNIDKTPPTITGKPDRDANANGWYNSDVTVGFDCHDALSGIASCTGPVTLGEGGSQSVTGTAVDAAGNSTSTTVSNINVDETPPSITGTPTTSPNTNGWYNGDVTIHWNCSDDLSGLDGPCPADSTISGEGANLSASATVFDLAGNHATATVNDINIDRTPPTTTSDAPIGWQNTDVVVNLSATDNLSGVDATNYILDGGSSQTGSSVVVGGQGVHHLEFWSVDNAGNEETHQFATVMIDETPPTIGHKQAPPPNGNGWNNTPVTVSFQCADQANLSGLASCPSDTTLSNEGANQTVTGMALDNAGNMTTDTASVNIDTTPPTITSSRSANPNANDWYNSDVTVKFSCMDTLSGVASCASPQQVGEGANQSVSGNAVDLAGNVATATDTGINVDTTPPTISGAPTTAANANNWYNSDVTVHWTCGDNLSGIESCPSNSTITGEGADLSTSAGVSDKAGNSATASVAHVNIDQTPPSTTASAPSGWVNNDVTVTLSATDNLSGVDATYYSLDGAAKQTGSSVVINTEGMHSLTYWSTDKAGNEEPHSTISILIDKTSPTITHSQSPAPNGKGWNNSDVTVTFSCSDALSGVASCTSPETVSSEGLSQPVTGTALDNAGNNANDTATVSVDKTPPTITGAPDRNANANGWYNAGVTVSFTCQDALSGVASCTTPVAFGQGANQSTTGTAVDAAGNSTSATVSGINVDVTPPTITGAATTSPNANGWYRGPVTIHWTCSDNLSGLDGPCPADSVVSGEGASLSASATISDLAGNHATATVNHIKIDGTAPTTTSDAPNGWQRTNVTVNFNASDNLSGVVATDYSVDGGPTMTGTSVSITANGTHHITFWSVDAAGNVETQRSATVELDKLPPTITGAATTAPNANGWYNSPVVVHFVCNDQAGLSGVASCTADQTLSTSGANQSVTGVATDVAGNSASYTVAGINIDLVSPTIAINGISDGAMYALGAVPTPSCTASDTLSGPNGCTGSVSGGSTNGVGTYTYKATGFDKAGNATTRTATYNVDYGFSGFLQPINDTAHQVGLQTSIFKAGSTVPVKFQLTKSDGTVISAAGAPQWLTPVKGAPLSAAVDQSVYGAVATDGTTYRSDGQQYIYNWSTKDLPAGFYYRIGVRLDDGSTYTVNIGLR
jgi:hypothetical protein